MRAVCRGHVHDEPQFLCGVVDVLSFELPALCLQQATFIWVKSRTYTFHWKEQRIDTDRVELSFNARAYLRRPSEPLVGVERPVHGAGDDDHAPPDRLEQQPADDEAAHGALRGQRRHRDLQDGQ